MRRDCLVVLLFLSVLVSPAFAETKVYAGVVRYVVDGDSLYLAGLKTQVRLWGVDAPERGEPGFYAARNTLKLLAAGKPLLCLRMDIDKYKRIVARCQLADVWVEGVPSVSSVDQFAGQSAADINAQAILAGPAREYCYFSKGFYGSC